MTARDEMVTLIDSKYSSLLHDLPQRILEAGMVSRRWAGTIARETKDHWKAAEGQDYSEVVTKVDIFIQDYLATFVQHRHPEISIFGEEEQTLVRTSAKLVEPAIIIDPIDGTEWFTQGETKQYAILVSFFDDAQIRWCMGLFPGTGEVIKADCNGVFENTLATSETRLDRVLAVHYRFMGPEYENIRVHLQDRGWSFITNGNGFGTNLGAVRLYNSHAVDAFLAPKMGIEDAWPTAFLLHQLGAELRFYSPDNHKWEVSPSWSYHDFGGNIGLRSKFIAARTRDLAEELEDILSGHYAAIVP